MDNKLEIKLVTADQIKEDVEERLDYFMSQSRGKETDYMKGQIDAYKCILKDINIIKKIYLLASWENNKGNWENNRDSWDQ